MKHKLALILIGLIISVAAIVHADTILYTVSDKYTGDMVTTTAATKEVVVKKNFTKTQIIEKLVKIRRQQTEAVQARDANQAKIAQLQNRIDNLVEVIAALKDVPVVELAIE